jgi:hypothetical protein
LRELAEQFAVIAKLILLKLVNAGDELFHGLLNRDWLNC